MNEPQGPCRELYFHERTVEEKIEKMASAIQYLTLKLKEAGECIGQLKKHSHNGGVLTIPLENSMVENRFSESYFFKNPLGLEKP